MPRYDNEVVKIKQEIDSGCYAVPQSDATVKICEGIIKLKYGEVDRYTTNRLNIEIGKKGEDVISLDLDNESCYTSGDFRIDNLDIAKNNIRASQIQLFQYILFKYNKQIDNVINIDIEDYFKFRSIKRRKENMDRFIEDLSILAHINLDLGSSNYGKKDRIIGNLLAIRGKVYAGTNSITNDFYFNKKVKYVVIELGSWINELKLNQYVYVSDSFFRYNSKTEWISVMLSIKIGQLVRVNKSKIIKNGQWSYSIEKMMQYLGIYEQELGKQGIKYYHNILKNSFKVLKKEGYSIEFNSNDIYGSVADFKQGSIVYNNDLLIAKYKDIIRKSKR